MFSGSWGETGPPSGPGGAAPMPGLGPGTPLNSGGYDPPASELLFTQEDLAANIGFMFIVF